ncbi:ice-binding family protein [Streptomyces sp. NBC_00390]|uniref:ice-binding family protein n=1 Tax=Streptomyces sp. NBC_00390 TaxID=2975736 RepID=UPI002E20DE35
MTAWIAGVLTLLVAFAVVAVTPTRANAATPVDLGTAESFAVLAGAEVTNTGPSVVTGDVGVHPGTSISGFPPGTVNGTSHSGDTVAEQAKTDLVAAYNDAAGQASNGALPPDAGGLTLVPGVYTASSSLGLTGTLTLNAQGDPNAVWVFQVGSTLTTASNSSVSLINGASPCNVFWQIGSSATLGTGTTFVGTIMAKAAITVATGATIDGRALAEVEAVTLDTNRITRPECAGTTTTTTTGDAATTTTTGDAATTTTTGDAATTTTTGDAATGDAATGDAATGDAATGDAATGDAATGDAATGDAATGDAATGDAATGDAATGDAATGDAATGDAATGDAATGDAATGDAATGDAATGDAATGDDGGYHDGGYHDGGYHDGGYHDGGYHDGGYHDGGYDHGGYNDGDTPRSPASARESAGCTNARSTLSELFPRLSAGPVSPAWALSAECAHG